MKSINLFNKIDKFLKEKGFIRIDKGLDIRIEKEKIFTLQHLIAEYKDIYFINANIYYISEKGFIKLEIYESIIKTFFFYKDIKKGYYKEFCESGELNIIKIKNDNDLNKFKEKVNLLINNN